MAFLCLYRGLHRHTHTRTHVRIHTYIHKILIKKETYLGFTINLDTKIVRFPCNLNSCTKDVYISFLFNLLNLKFLSLPL